MGRTNKDIETLCWKVLSKILFCHWSPFRRTFLPFFPIFYFCISLIFILSSWYFHTLYIFNQNFTFAIPSTAFGILKFLDFIVSLFLLFPGQVSLKYQKWVWRVYSFVFIHILPAYIHQLLIFLIFPNLTV